MLNIYRCGQPVDICCSKWHCQLAHAVAIFHPHAIFQCDGRKPNFFTARAPLVFCKDKAQRNYYWSHKKRPQRHFKIPSNGQIFPIYSLSHQN